VLHGNAPRVEQLDCLPYLSAVLKESMRLLPPVAYGLRRATIDFDLSGVPVHSGDWVIFSNYLTHMNPEIYPYPKRFLPERWFAIEPSQYEYLPFSAGPRWCIGKPLAMMTMKLSLAVALQKWRWQVQPQARIDQRVRVTMRPRHGLPMMLAPQDREFCSVPVTGNILKMVEFSETIPMSAAAPAYRKAA
jgi:cytochrome P450